MRIARWTSTSSWRETAFSRRRLGQSSAEKPGGLHRHEARLSVLEPSTPSVWSRCASSFGGRALAPVDIPRPAIMNRAWTSRASSSDRWGSKPSCFRRSRAGSRTSPTSSPGQPRSTRGGPLSTGSSSSPAKSISPRSCSLRTTGPPRMRPRRARRRRATTSCSRLGCSAARSASGVRSSSTRTVRSCRVTWSG